MFKWDHIGFLPVTSSCNLQHSIVYTELRAPRCIVLIELRRYTELQNKAASYS